MDEVSDRVSYGQQYRLELTCQVNGGFRVCNNVVRQVFVKGGREGGISRRVFGKNGMNLSPVTRRLDLLGNGGPIKETTHMSRDRNQFSPSRASAAEYKVHICKLILLSNSKVLYLKMMVRECTQVVQVEELHSILRWPLAMTTLVIPSLN